MKNKPTVIFEDADMLVIDKPAGLLVHAGPHSHEPTVAEWFLARNPEAKGVGELQFFADGSPIERSGVVHRLDKETSGVLVLAKNQYAYEHLKTEFHDRNAQKEYRAVVVGFMKEIAGRIEKPIGRSRSDARKRTAERGAAGVLRDAVTEWKLITQNSAFAYLRIFPKTGRTHQIRVHLKSITHPIVGDKLYAGKAGKRNPVLPHAPLMLHAYAITLTIPSGGQKTFTAPLPPAFESVLKEQNFIA